MPFVFVVVSYYSKSVCVCVCSLVPRWLKANTVCAVAWRILQCLFKRTEGGRRDIYTEILEDPHTCPLSQVTHFLESGINKVLYYPKAVFD